MKEPVLVFHKPGVEVVVETDTSDKALEAYLLYKKKMGSYILSYTILENSRQRS
jgi:hypothetical protein